MGYLFAVIFIYALSQFMRPNITEPKAASLEDFDLPTAKEGRVITVVLGTREITSPNVVWYGDLRIKKVKTSKK